MSTDIQPDNMWGWLARGLGGLAHIAEMLRDAQCSEGFKRDIWESCNRILHACGEVQALKEDAG